MSGSDRREQRAQRAMGTRVLGITIALTVIFGAFGGWSLQHSYQQNKVAARDDVERTASLSGALAGQLVSSAFQSLFVLSTSPPFRSGELDAIRQQILGLNPTLLGFQGSITWVDAQGVVQAQSPPPDDPSTPPVVVSDREYFNAALAGRPTVSDLVDGRVTGTPAVVFAVPTLDQAGVPNGIVTASVSTASLDPASLRSLFGTDTLTVLDRQGQVVFGDPTLNTEDFATLGSGTATSGITERDPDRESGSVVAWTTVSSAGWLILVERSDEEVYGAAYRQFVNSSVVLAIIVAAALLGGLWASRWLNRSHVELVKGQSLLRTVLEQLPAAVVVVDQDRRSQVANPQAETVLSSLGITNGSAGAVDALEPLKNALHDGTVVRGVDVTLGTGDDERILSVSAAPVVNGNRITAATAVFDDVTDLRSAERHAREMAATLTALAAAEWPEQIGALVVDEGAASLGADDAALLLVDNPGSDSVRSVTLSPLAAGENMAAWTAGTHPAHALATSAARTGMLETRREGGHEWSVIPLQSAGRLAAVLALRFPATDSPPTGRMVMLRGFAAQVAQALDRSLRRRIEHDIALELQRSLLEPVESSGSGLDVSCRYIPAESHLEVGGDLYDVITTPDGVVLLVIGDIVGHGLTAATAMGQLRSAIRTLAATTVSPARILDALDRGVGMMPACWMATVAIVSVDPATHRLTYGIAGHPHPLLRHADGSVARLQTESGPPLGLAREPRGEASVELPADRSMLCMYTDGLVERRGETIEDGIARAVGAVGDAGSPTSADVADSLLDELADPASQRDDIALVCAFLPAG